MAKLWALSYEPLLCPTCGYNMGLADPDPEKAAKERGKQCSDCRITQPDKGQTVDHLVELLEHGDMDQRQFLATLLEMARGGGEKGAEATKAVGANPHALDALAEASGGFRGGEGRTYDSPLPPPPKLGPNDLPPVAPELFDAPAAKSAIVDPIKILEQGHARSEAKKL